MAEIRFTDAALDDLGEIEAYSAANFGASATVAYLEALRSGLVKLLRQSGIGTPRDDLERGMRSYRCSSHRIFYQGDQTGILVVRVLHYARNITRDTIR